MTMLDRNISVRIAVLRFPTILGVLFIHGTTTTMHTAEGVLGTNGSSPVVDVVKYIVASEIAAPAVPILFLISGFLLFEGFEMTWSACKGKLRRRLETLLIPFLFWNLLTLGLLLLGEIRPATRSYFVGNPQWPLLTSFGWMDYLRAFGIGGAYPIAYQFWYVRDLMGLVLLSPLIWVILKSKAALPFIICVSLLWTIGWWPLLWPNVGVVFFFCLGAYLSSNKMDICILDARGKWIILAAYIPMLFIDVLSRGSAENNLFHKATILLGITIAWWLTSLVCLNPALTTRLTHLGEASFFVFAAHEPVLTIFRRLLLGVLAQHPVAASLCYCLISIGRAHV